MEKTHLELSDDYRVKQVPQYERNPIRKFTARRYVRRVECNRVGNRIPRKD